MITAEPLKIEKCANCGHDIMARDDLVKHTNIKDGHRYFTLHCQECGCKSPARPPDGGTELTLEVNQPRKPRPEGTFGGSSLRSRAKKRKRRGSDGGKK